MLLPAPRGIPLIGARGGGCTVLHTVWDGRSMCPLPPWVGGWGDGFTEAGRRSGVHKTGRERAAGPWEGRRGRYLTSALLSFRRAGSPWAGIPGARV